MDDGLTDGRMDDGLTDGQRTVFIKYHQINCSSIIITLDLKFGHKTIAKNVIGISVFYMIRGKKLSNVVLVIY